MKLRKRPVIIEANQYTDPENPPKGCSVGYDGKVYVRDKINTVRVFPDIGDWVFTQNGVDYYVLTDDYIKEHFEEVSVDPSHELLGTVRIVSQRIE